MPEFILISVTHKHTERERSRSFVLNWPWEDGALLCSCDKNVCVRNGSACSTSKRTHEGDWQQLKSVKWKLLNAKQA